MYSCIYTKGDPFSKPIVAKNGAQSWENNILAKLENSYSVRTTLEGSLRLHGVSHAK
jgi:hypothetical protein